MSDFIRLPRHKIADMRTALLEIEGADTMTRRFTNLLTELAHQCETLTHHHPVLDFSVTSNATVATLTVTGVPALTFNGASRLVQMHLRDVAALRFVVEDVETTQRLTTGCVQVSVWRADVPAQARCRDAYVPPKLHKRLKRCVEVDFTDLNADADDRATLDELVGALICMARVMPDLAISVEPIFKRVGGVAEFAAAHASLASVAPKKRRVARGRAAHHAEPNALEDDTVHSEHDAAVGTADSNHVGFCVFCAKPPNFDFAFLDYLKSKFGNRILEMCFLAPSSWTEQPTIDAPTDAKPTTTISPPAELAICVRRACCTEEESGEHAVAGSNRLKRVLLRNAKAFGGVPCDGKTS